MYKRKVIAVILLASFIANAAPQPVSCADGYEYKNKCFEQYLSNLSSLFLSKNQSLTTFESRDLYNKEIRKIPEAITNCIAWDTTAEEVAHFAVEARNICKNGSRGAMKCIKCAENLYKSEPNYTVKDIFSKYSNNPQLIIEKSLATRASANFASKFADFFETHTPRLYEHVLFPSFMSFSRQLKAHPALIILAISGCVVGVLATTTSGLAKRLSTAVSTNIRRLKNFCFGAKTEKPQIQDEIDDGTEEDTDEDLIKNKDSLSSSVKTTKEASSSITRNPDLAECSGINEQ